MTAMMIEAAARALLFALVVGAGLRLFRVSNVPVRKGAWSLVLLASLAMPFLMRWPAIANWRGPLGWTLPIPMHSAASMPTPAKKVVPLAPVHEATIVLATVSGEAPDTTAPDTVLPPTPIAVSAVEDQTTALTPAHARTSGNGPRIHLPPSDRLLVMLYLGVAGVLLLRLLWGLATALRLWITADLVSPLVVPEPNVKSSARIPSPVTIGSGIVLPAEYINWDMKKLRMVVAHERSHVRQQDFYLQLLAGLYTVVFWFSPLGWWLRRTIGSLGEAIGDRAGMDAAASGSRYAEVLLEFAAMPRQSLPGVAMARPGNLSHRIERLLNEHLFRSAFAEGRRRALVSLLLIPVALFAATALIRVQGAAAQTAPAPPVAPSTPAADAAPTPAAAPAAPGAPADAPVVPQAVATPGAVPVPAPPVAPGSSPTPALAPAPPATSVIQAPAVAPAPPDLDGIVVDDSPDVLVSDDDQEGKGYAFGFSDGRESYAIIDGPGNTVSFSGNWNDHRNAEIAEARKAAKGPFLWFTHESKSYIVTDPAVIAKIRAMYKSMEPLSRQQEILGKQQEALGKQMEELARQQEAAGQVKMPDLSREMAELDAAVAKAKEEREKLSTKEMVEAEVRMKAAQDQMMTPEKLAELQAQLASAQAAWSSGSMAELQAKLGEMQAKLGELQGQAGARQGGFGAKMGTLGEQQGKLGAEQGRLGAEQGRIAQRADQEARRIIEECLRNGKAQQLPQVH